MRWLRQENQNLKGELVSIASTIALACKKNNKMAVIVPDAGHLCECQDLGLLEYSRALSLQKQILEKKLTDRSTPDRLFIVQHPAVFTLGRRGGLENLMVSRTFLEEKNIQVIQTDRGGNITFHAPGQIVMYPVMDLEQNRLSVPEFVWRMEKMMKLACHHFNVPADRNERNHGLWVGNAKIGSVGIALKKGISIHGLALNVTPDLVPFSWINPCGLEHMKMTSVAQQLLKKSDMASGSTPPDSNQLLSEIKKLLLKAFLKLFNRTVLEIKHDLCC